MASIRKIKVVAFACSACRYLREHGPTEACARLGHRASRANVTKRFFACADCGAQPIRGPRWRGADVDLCDACRRARAARGDRQPFGRMEVRLERYKLGVLREYDVCMEFLVFFTRPNINI